MRETQPRVTVATCDEQQDRQHHCVRDRKADELTERTCGRKLDRREQEHRIRDEYEVRRGRDRERKPDRDEPRAHADTEPEHACG